MIKWDQGLNWLSFLGLACNSWQKVFKRKKRNYCFQFQRKFINQTQVGDLLNFKALSAAFANSGPLDFPSEKSFLLFFAHEKG